MDAVSKMASSLVIYLWSTHFFNRFFSLHKPLWFVKGFPCSINLQSLTIFLKINDKHSLNTLQALSIYPRWTIYKFETVSNNQYTQFGYRTQFMICWTEQFQKENVHPKSTTRKLQNESYCVYVKVGIPFLRPCYFASETCILESYSRYHLPSHTTSPAVTGKYPEKSYRKSYGET